MLVLGLFSCNAFAADKTLLEPDGTLATPVHRIPLYDAEGKKISLGDDPVLPFSTKQTCGKCHDYEKIRTGLHFSSEPAGRAGEPWILYEPNTASQIPITRRGWPDTYRPEAIGLGPFRFVRVFGRHMPGGGPGERVDPDEKDARWLVTGKFKINCLACHNADPNQDQNEAAVQLGQQNFMWAAAAACGLAEVKGAAAAVPDSYDPFMESDEGGKGPKVLYDPSRFDSQGRVLFNITRDIPNTRCLFCHTSKPVGPAAPQRWQRDGDVHLAAGMQCVDCHRNGLDHKMNRGYPGEAAADPSLTCRGCHLGEDAKTGRKILGGRFAAPYPQHRGLPALHLDKLTCTACHSGPMPQPTVGRIQTSRAHRLGIHGKYRGEDSPPYIVGPVFMRTDDGTVAPHNLMYPSYWAVASKPGPLTPMDPTDVLAVAAKELVSQAATEADSQSDQTLTQDQIENALSALAGKYGQAPLYVFGDRAQLFDIHGYSASALAVSKPTYAWPVAHAVRPARQAMGAQNCRQCHSKGSPFFGDVPVLSLVDGESGSTPMTVFMDLDGAEVTRFAESFAFRAYLKIVLWIAAALIAVVVFVYGLKAVRATCGCFSGEGPRHA